MIEVEGNLWDYEPADARAVTVNQTVTSYGSNAMGGGSAGECVDKFPGIQYLAGSLMRMSESHVVAITPDMIWQYCRKHSDYALIMYPTMPAWDYKSWDREKEEEKKEKKKGSWKDSWKSTASAKVEIVAESARETKDLADFYGWENVIIPRPGSGIGGLDYEKEVRPALEEVFTDDRFVIITFKGGQKYAHSTYADEDWKNFKWEKRNNKWEKIDKRTGKVVDSLSY